MFQAKTTRNIPHLNGALQYSPNNPDGIPWLSKIHDFHNHLRYYSASQPQCFECQRPQHRPRRNPLLWGVRRRLRLRLRVEEAVNSPTNLLRIDFWHRVVQPQARFEVPPVFGLGSHALLVQVRQLDLDLGPDAARVEPHEASAVAEGHGEGKVLVPGASPPRAFRIMTLLKIAESREEVACLTGSQPAPELLTELGSVTECGLQRENCRGLASAVFRRGREVQGAQLLP